MSNGEHSDKVNLDKLINQPLRRNTFKNSADMGAPPLVRMGRFQTPPAPRDRKRRQGDSSPIPSPDRTSPSQKAPVSKPYYPAPLMEVLNLQNKKIDILSQQVDILSRAVRKLASPVHEDETGHNA